MWVRTAGVPIGSRRPVAHSQSLADRFGAARAPCGCRLKPQRDDTPHPLSPARVARALVVCRQALARAEDQRPTVGAAAALVAALSILALLGGPNDLLFDNLQEIVAAAGGAVALAIASRSRVGPTRRLLVSLAISLAGAGLGMVAWDVSHGVGAPLTTFGDVVFVASVIIAVVAILPAIFAGIGRALLVGIATDALILFLAGIAVVAAIWAATDATPIDRTASVGAVLLVAATGGCIFALIARQIVPAGQGPWVLLVGAAILGASWLMWVGDPTAPSTVGLSDFMFSAGLLLIAYGGVTWSTRQSSSRVFDRIAPLLAGGLPVVAIVGSLGLTAVAHSHDILDLVGISTAAVILASVGRQAHLYAREAQARDGERRAFVALEATNRELTASAAQIEDLYNRAPVGYHSLDADGLIVRINDTELSWLGYERSDVVGRLHFVDLLEPGSDQGFSARFETFKSAGVLRDVEYALTRADGTTLPVLVAATAIRDEAGRFFMSRGTVWDLTERRRAEEAVRASEERYRTLFEQATDSIAVLSPDGRLIDANPACSTLLGYTIPELHDLVMEDLVAPAAREDYEAARVRVLDGSPVLVELQLKCKDDALVCAEVSAKLRADGNVQVLISRRLHTP